MLVVKEDFALKIPDALRPEVAAPILCAGMTTYPPMKHWGVKAGDKVGIIGFGGFGGWGEMAAKLAKAMGADVTVFTTRPAKLGEGERLGVNIVLEDDKDQLAALASSFDFMLDHSRQARCQSIHQTAEARLRAGRGRRARAAGTSQQPIAGIHRKSVAGSLIGNMSDKQEVLDFCAEHGIGPDIEVIAIQDINEAYRKVEHGEVRFRYVIDMSTLKANANS